MFSNGNKVDVFQPMSSRSKPKWRFFSLHGGCRLWKIKPLPLMGVFIVIFLFFLPATVKRQYLHTQTMKNQSVQIKAPYDFELKKDVHVASGHEVDYLPRGIVQATSDMELKPLWVSSTRLKDNKGSNRSLLAMPVGIKQKQNVDFIVRKFFAENFSIVLFHYDGNVDGWNDLEWCSKVIHIAAANQTKWWYAKRFLHPDIISLYDYLFLWDEDLGVENFHPGRYLSVIKDEELEISQPALDTHLSSEIHHGITMRNKSGLVHRRTYGYKGSLKCSEESEGPPCTGWVEGMAPVFSRAAWRCAWHLIQNDLVHGWGMDMKLGYCAQGDPTKKVGVVDSEYIVHQGIPSLGGGSLAKKSSDTRVSDKTAPKGRTHVPFDPRTQVRRQASSELEAFTKRWNQATQEDKNWMDPFSHNESGDETTMGNGDVVSSSRRSQKVRKNNTDRKRFFPQRHRPK